MTVEFFITILSYSIFLFFYVLFLETGKFAQSFVAGIFVVGKMFKDFFDLHRELRKQSVKLEFVPHPVGTAIISLAIYSMISNIIQGRWYLIPAYLIFVWSWTFMFCFVLNERR